MSAAHTLPFPALAEASGSGKENAPLKQTTLLGALDKGTTKSRKRTITLVNGDELDLTASIPVTLEACFQRVFSVLDAMRLRIIELEDELASPPPAKRTKTTASAVAAVSTSTAAPTASLSKAEEKKRKMQIKKIFDRCPQEGMQGEGLKFQGSAKTIKFDELFETAEFEALFGGKGRLVQPTPQNKPKSAVTIIEFNTTAHLESFFGDELKPLKGNLWSRGGVPTRGFGFFGGGGGGFSKSVKHGACDVAIRSAEISYSKNNLKCTLKFEVGQVGGGDGYDSDY
ncbi:hypothetical protein B0H17DRAFT_1133857 [Mycena rosella]|uniref:Uncharacterized protein n=1 Tax=Mycena rosella TaxID=1033263 RepID=A0AAD7DH67_MYCRO|nr:hypothetical protein B0H17DRAFT_1133857 [Mycena rosella]